MLIRSWLGALYRFQQTQVPVCCAGFVQASGWPSVVAIMANWYGKGKRGLIMGLWNAHTSVGNMLVCSQLAFVWGIISACLWSEEVFHEGGADVPAMS